MTSDSKTEMVTPTQADRIDWSSDDNVGVLYRKRAPTVADYDEAIADLQRAREAIASGNESRGCAVCTDGGHGVRTCHHNPLVAARRWVIERGRHRCYHCGFVALTDDQAQEHFGRCEDEVAKCISERVRLAQPPQSSPADGEVAALRKGFMMGHSDGWRGNQLRRDTQMVDAEKSWQMLTENGAIDKAIDALLTRTTESPSGLVAGCHVPNLIENLRETAIGCDHSNEAGLAALCNCAANVIEALSAAPATASATGGWVVMNAAGDKWRSFKNGLPIWTEHLRKAIRYARREDAEMAHSRDGEAWVIQPVNSDPVREGMEIAAKIAMSRAMQYRERDTVGDNISANECSAVAHAIRLEAAALSQQEAGGTDSGR